ncbi:GCS-domain-containing protein [Piromyces finnis]|uniref:Glutamate--cysteine ligase n=1 Tax=Piromyces finnis TaxID=1754191 RepID=A0A1Y1UYC6_9FUNG|nr:GCS-domain-containing protein [Piromyces finnis]|eukprot:ORX43424.1 GCS-domain-containing protein [Piromyces finnis]
MGLLSLGTPMTWDDAKKKSDFIHGHGITQFLNVWEKVSGTKKDSEDLLWGDEIEYSIVNMDKNNKVARLSLNAAEILSNLQEDELLQQNYQASWKPEYAKYMIEGTPGLPYGSKLKDLLKVEDNMKLRRKLIREKLGKNEVVVSITAFPTLGAPDFLYPNYYHPNPDPKLISLSPDLFKNIDFRKYEDQLSLEEILDNSKPSCSQSLFIPDQAITDHARFPTLTANIRQRRGSKVAVNLPIYKDHLTPKPFKESIPESISLFVDRFAKHQNKSQPIDKNDNTLYSPSISSGSDGSDSESIYCHSLNEPINQETLKSEYHNNQYTLPEVIVPAKEDHVYLDCMCFGMGCSCLQVTFQASEIQEARFIYDSLAPITPILLALSAGAPAYKGYLVDTDCRWNVISGSVDDRNPIERGLREALPGEIKENGQPFEKINKSRYDSIDSYLSIGPDYAKTGHDNSKKNTFKEKYNDIDLVYDKDIYNNLINHDVDDLLAKHIAHLFIRDPLVIFNELLYQDDENSTDHFENIQSTNWQTLRFKPPPPNSDIGWRIEFRSMEIQLTDFANAAFSIFLLLLTRTIKALNLNFYIPISKIDENMQVAQVRDAARTKKFWFRRNILPLQENEIEDDTYELMTIDQIINGFEDEKGTFPGLLCLVCEYLSKSEVEKDVFNKLNFYINFISKRASGELVTDAVWIRDFITHHKDYKHDSKVHSSIVYDLLTVLEGVNQRRLKDLLKIIDTVGVNGIFSEEEKVKYENEIKTKLEHPSQEQKETNLKKKRIFESLNNCYSKKIKCFKEKETISSSSQDIPIENANSEYVR